MDYSPSMSVAEIEAAISNLPPEDFARLRSWFIRKGHLLEAAHRPAISLEEIERRGADIASGKVKPVKGRDFLKRIDQIRREVSHS
jgi:hypothetical protein